MSTSPPADRRRQIWGTVLGIAIGGVLLALVIARIDRQELLESFAGLRPAALLPAFLVALLQVPLRPWRWASSFPPARPVGLRPCFEVLAIGNLANYLLPGRGGDLLRCLLLRRRAGVRVSLGLATLGVEKLLDGLALVSVLAVAALYLPAPPWLARLALFAGAAFAVVLLALLVLRARAVPLGARLRRYGAGLGDADGDDLGLGRIGHGRADLRVRLARRLADPLDRFAAGLAVVGAPRRLLSLALQTALIVLGEAWTIWLLARALGVDIDFVAAIVFVAVLGLGFMLPAAPGFVGTYEFFGIAALALFAVPPAPAAAVTLLTHAWSFLWTLLVGLIGMALGGLSPAAAVDPTTAG